MEGLLSLSPEATPVVPAGGGQGFTFVSRRAEETQAQAGGWRLVPSLNLTKVNPSPNLTKINWINLAFD